MIFETPCNWAMAKNREEGPVDLTKSKFSIDFLLEKSSSSGQITQTRCDSRRGRPDDFPSRSVSPEALEEGDDEPEDERIDSPSTSRHDQHDERRKRPRTAFTGTQIKTLEAEFEKNKYLSVVKRIELSKTLGLSQQQLKVWYQNRRTKWKRKYANDLETMAQQYYNSMGLAGSRPMLIGDRLWIFNSPHDVTSTIHRGGIIGDGPQVAPPPMSTPPLRPPGLARTGPPFLPFSPFTSLVRPAFPPLARPLGNPKDGIFRGSASNSSK